MVPPLLDLDECPLHMVDDAGCWNEAVAESLTCFKST